MNIATIIVSALLTALPLYWLELVCRRGDKETSVLVAQVVIYLLLFGTAIGAGHYGVGVILGAVICLFGAFVKATLTRRIRP